MNEPRFDKWMWAVPIFKTRTIAAEACKKGRISINGALAKAARTVKPGDVIQVRKPPVTYSFKVLQTIEKQSRHTFVYNIADLGPARRGRPNVTGPSPEPGPGPAGGRACRPGKGRGRAPGRGRG